MPKNGHTQQFQGPCDAEKSCPKQVKSDSHRGLTRIALSLLLAATACSPIDAPDPRTANIPAPVSAEARRKALNENNNSVTIVELSKDVLVPKFSSDDPLPETIVGPLNFRGETLSNALELILADLNIPIAFETNEGLRRRITISNLSGSIDKVVERVCSLANLYCAYDDGVLVIRDAQLFTVALPPMGGNDSDSDSNSNSDSGSSNSGNSGNGDSDSGDAIDDIAAGLTSITKMEVSTDPTTNTLIYTATQRSAKLAEQYFTRLRANTALIVYETYIWEVQLTHANATGIRWEKLGNIGKFNTGITLDGGFSNAVSGTPISIGLPTSGEVDLASGDIFRFLSEQGAVKTISQPQISVLSGSSASMTVAETQNYISELTRTVDDNGDETVSTSTGQVDSGFTLEIDSAWDDSTVYGKIDIQLDEFLGFEEFQAGTNGTLSLPRTSTREVSTTVRVRPGDSILIAGLVREQDTFNRQGPGFNQPLLPTSRDVSTSNSELVLMLRPRVIVYKPIDKEAIEAAKKLPEDLSKFIYDPATMPDRDLSVDLVDPSGPPQIEMAPLKQDIVPLPAKEPAPPAVEKDWRK